MARHGFHPDIWAISASILEGRALMFAARELARARVGQGQLRTSR